MKNWLLLGVVFWCVIGSEAWAQKGTGIEYEDVAIHTARTSVADGALVSVHQSNVVGFDVSVSGTASVTFRVSGPGRFGWNSLTCYASNSTTGVTSTSTTGFYQCNVSAGDVVSARLNACTACTVSVVARASTAVYGGGGGGGGGGGSGVSVVEDAAHSNGESIVPLGCRRKDTATSSAGTDGDWATVDCDANGAVRVRIDSTAVGSTSTDDDGTVTAGTTSMSEMLNRNYVYNGTDWVRERADPCASSAKTFLPINISTATTTEITPSLAGASTNYYICSIIILPTAGAQTLAVVDDDSDGCGSVTSGLAGGTSAASGATIAANGGWVAGNGSSSIMKTNGTNRVICIVTGSAVQTSGVMAVVAAP